MKPRVSLLVFRRSSVWRVWKTLILVLIMGLVMCSLFLLFARFLCYMFVWVSVMVCVCLSI